MNESVVVINDNYYRYGYDPDTQKTHYLGPVGEAPQLSEEQFMAAVEFTDTHHMWNQAASVGNLLRSKGYEVRSVQSHHFPDGIAINTWSGTPPQATGHGEVHISGDGRRIYDPHRLLSVSSMMVRPRATKQTF
jgi:hypothetical protein